jgi:hypothetical protein
VGDDVSGLKKVGEGVAGEGVGLNVGTLGNRVRHPHNNGLLSAGSPGALQVPAPMNQSGMLVKYPSVTPACSPIMKPGNVQSSQFESVLLEVKGEARPVHWKAYGKVFEMAVSGLRSPVYHMSLQLCAILSDPSWFITGIVGEKVTDVPSTTGVVRSGMLPPYVSEEKKITPHV